LHDDVFKECFRSPSIAQALASAFSGNSQVSVNAFGNQLAIKATGTGSATNYPYTLSTSYNSGVFSSPSFVPTPASGNLAGGTNGAVPIYTFNAAGGYDSNGNVLAYTDSVMGGWQFGYDQVNRLITATATTAPLPNAVTPPAPNWGQNFCWAYDPMGNRLQQATSNVPFNATDGSCTTTAMTQFRTLSSTIRKA
jgi:YD repeat-containing protein